MDRLLKEVNRYFCISIQKLDGLQHISGACGRVWPFQGSLRGGWMGLGANMMNSKLRVEHLWGDDWEIKQTLGALRGVTDRKII